MAVFGDFPLVNADPGKSGETPFQQNGDLRCQMWSLMLARGCFGHKILPSIRHGAVVRVLLDQTP